MLLRTERKLGLKIFAFKVLIKKMIKQITFRIGGPLRGMIESPVKEFLDL